ncbi:HAMP domain-containing protein [Streptomyces sp. NPDC127084]|uniref:cache domain-containing protein n=1 Tax=Streptomyces sp. NPDC127084 TaxID=3347133 RepID=UPI003659E8B6
MSLLGGIRPPIAVLSVLLLALAGVTALSLVRVTNDRVPKAVLTSQQHFAEDGAIALRASIDESVTDLTRTAGLFNAGDPVPADSVLDKIGNVYQKWLGVAVVEIKSGKLLAARGENVPLTAIDRAKLGDENGLTPRLVRLPNGETRLLALAVLNWPGESQKLLVASSGLKVPGVSLGSTRAIAVVDQQGQVLSQDGIPELDQAKTAAKRKKITNAAKQLKVLAASAAEQADEHPIKAKEPGSGGFPGVSGSILGERYLDERVIAGYATLAGAQPGESTSATRLGLRVVAMVDVEEDTTVVSKPVFGLLAAGALLVIGGVTVAVLIGTVQRPLIRLFLESRRLTRGEHTRPVTAPRYGEGARIGAALERLRRQLVGESVDEAPARRRTRLSARTVLVVCGVLLLAWCAPLMLLFNRAGDSVSVPLQVVRDQRERTDTVNDRVRRGLNEGHADLASVAALIGEGTEPADMTKVLQRTMSEHPRYDSLYVVGPGGDIIARVGAEPHSPAGKKPGKEQIRLLDDQGKEPVVIGTAEIADRKGAAVVGEFRIEFLNSLVKRPGLGVVRVVDSKGRVIAGNSGFLAFEDLPNDRLKSLVQRVNKKSAKDSKDAKDAKEGDLDPRYSRYRDGGTVQIAAAAPFDGGGAAKTLGWTVVSWQPASGLAIPEYNLQNRTVLAGLLGVTAATACLGWLYIIVVRPLRALVGQAEALADGDRRTVLYPRHHDEVGAVVRSLELIRQQLPGQQRKRDGMTSLAGRN